MADDMLNGCFKGKGNMGDQHIEGYAVGKLLVKGYGIVQSPGVAGAGKHTKSVLLIKFSLIVFYTFGVHFVVNSSATTFESA